MTSRTLLVVSLLALAPRVRAQGNLLLESHVGERPRQTRELVEYLTGQLGAESPVHGAALKQLLESRLSSDPGPLDASAQLKRLVDAGRRQFLEGEYQTAIVTLEQARLGQTRHTALLAGDQALRQPLYQTLMYLAHAYLRTGQNEKAVERVSEVVRSFPDRDLSVATFGPQVVKLYRQVRAELDRQRRTNLSIRAEPAGCLVFLNERFVGLSPARVTGLPPGRYRVYLQRPGTPGRVHSVSLAGGEEQLNVDFALDAALRTEPFVGLRYADEATRAQLEVEHAATVGQALDATQVTLVGIRHHQGRRVLQGTVVAVATGRPLRSGMLAVEPTPPSPAALRSLGRFLASGERGAAVIVRQDLSRAAQPREAAHADGRRGFWSPRVWRWITLGLGAAALAGGVTLLALDGQRSCDLPEGVRCPEGPYQTLAPGLGLTIGGGAMLATSVTLFVVQAVLGRREARAPRESARALRSGLLHPLLGPGRVGLGATLRF
ncbi:MAG: PEGA domain-containing protein [Deltaproteobacteria bacterium]|nr:PEGA domain-containing protein [Deltaproteobacteria bacterium]